MSDDTSITGWTDVDDGTPVAVRTAPTPAAVSLDAVQPPAAAGGRPAPMAVPQHSTRPIGTAAAVGVAVVLLGIALAAGIGGIRGDITGSSGNAPEPVTATITADGAFSPASVTVRVGQTLTIKNLNANPQVLKPSDSDRSLFPVQVLFQTPFTFTVPASANGTYRYTSETLPENQVLTIDVQPAIPLPFAETQQPASQALRSSQASQTNSAQGDIPIPFAKNNEIPIPFAASDLHQSSTSAVTSSTSTPSTSSSASTATSTSPSSSSSSLSSSSSPSISMPTTSTTTPTISVGGVGGKTVGGGNVSYGGGFHTSAYPTDTPSSISWGAATPIPVNPYTVGSTEAKNATRQAELAKNIQSTSTTLHKGAPLLEAPAVSGHRPSSVSSTGPANMFLLLIPAFLGMMVVFRRTAKEMM